MIRLIAALDDKLGLANDQGIPWDLPTDRAYAKEKTMGNPILMGFNTYLEFKSSNTGRRNLVLTDGKEPLREGFEAVTDIEEFMKNPPDNLWLFGGAGAFAQTINYADELYLTRVKGDFQCTKFFPEFEDKFELSARSEEYTENGTSYRFEIWKR